MPEAPHTVYDPRFSYLGMLLSTLPHLNLGGGPTDARGYRELDPLIHSDPDALKEAIDKSRVATAQGVIDTAARLTEQDWSGWMMKPLEARETRALVFTTPEDNTIVSFRGTQPTHFQQWILNLRARPGSMHTEHGDCRVHQGFLREWKDISVPLGRALENVERFDLTGHSAGGGLADLCALNIRDGDTRVERLYTYGKPRVGNAQFCELMEPFSEFRVVNAEDLVPRVPPQLWLPGKLRQLAYTHGDQCTEVLFGGEEKLSHLARRNERAMTVQAIAGDWLGIPQSVMAGVDSYDLLHTGVGKHSPGNYSALLRADLERSGQDVAVTRSQSAPPRVQQGKPVALPTPAPVQEKGRQAEPPQR